MSELSDIPQDVWTEAERLFVLAIDNPEELDRPAPSYIARAILAERQRCIAVANAHRGASAPSQADLIGSIVHIIASGEETP